MLPTEILVKLKIYRKIWPVTLEDSLTLQVLDIVKIFSFDRNTATTSNILDF